MNGNSGAVKKNLRVKRPCKGDFLDKFVQPAILSLLCERPAHGFYLLAELNARGLARDVDATGMYRSLHRLEQDGKLTCKWDSEEGSKPRKVYFITDSGIQCLRNWQQALHKYIVDIERISETIDNTLDEIDRQASS